MAPTAPLLAALFSLSNADDEVSMLQVPLQKVLQADSDECRCPGYYEAECRQEVAQGCSWSSEGSSNGPWCQCLGVDNSAPVDADTVTLPPPGGSVTVSPVPDPATCPSDWVQQGAVGADVGGCGLQTCDERYGTESEVECAASCDAMEDCAGFTYAPMNGDRNHEGVTVCTMYSTDRPTGSWTTASGIAVQVFCARPIVEVETTHWNFGVRHTGQYLAGHAAGDSTIRTVQAAAARCDELADACGGITCRSESSCTVRAASDLLASPSGEFSFLKAYSIAPVAGSYSSGHAGQYLAGHAAGDSTIRPMSEAQLACDQLDDQCSGITCRSEVVAVHQQPSSCTVRAGSDLRASPSGEFSFLKAHLILEYTMVDGCTTQNAQVERAVVSEFDDATASVRCCSISGDTCDSDHLDGGCQSDKTYVEATALCAANGERLCTEVEIDSQLCCSTGCNFDGHQVWVLHEDINPNYSASHRGQYLGGYAAGDSTIRPISDAQEACDLLEDACGGITCRSDTSCTVRAGTDLRTSPSGEFSFVRH